MKLTDIEIQILNNAILESEISLLKYKLELKEHQRGATLAIHCVIGVLIIMLIVGRLIWLA